MPHSASKIARRAGLAAAVVIALAVLPFAFAARSETAWTAAFQITAFARRTLNFPSAWRNRSRACSLGDAWSQAIRVSTLEEHRIAAHSRTIKREDPLVLVGTPYGAFWIPAQDQLTIYQELAEQAENIYDGQGRGIKPGDVVLDCGANVGVFTRHALDRGAKLVVAIEPVPQTVECLRRNFAGEIARGRVIVYPKGVWDKDAELELRTNDLMASTADSVAIDRGKASGFVPLTTIDKLVGELQVGRVDFIKMDIEGSELHALRGAVNTVARFHPGLAISTEHRLTDVEDVPHLIASLWSGYHGYCSACTNVRGSVQPDVYFAY